MEIMKIYVNILESHEVISNKKTVRMLLFDGNCDGDYVQGNILPGGVDTQTIDSTGKGTLSARYMIQGTDFKKQPCHIFIENIAHLDGETVVTTPKIVTDSEALRWLEQEELMGRLEQINGQLTITIETKKEKHSKRNGD